MNETGFEISVLGPRRSDGSEPLQTVTVPALPRQGDYISIEGTALHGTVKVVTFWWDEVGKLHIEAKIGFN
jgi:hypothetical protein